MHGQSDDWRYVHAWAILVFFLLIFLYKQKNTSRFIQCFYGQFVSRLLHIILVYVALGCFYYVAYDTSLC